MKIHKKLSKLSTTHSHRKVVSVARRGIGEQEMFNRSSQHCSNHRRTGIRESMCTIHELKRRRKHLTSFGGHWTLVSGGLVQRLWRLSVAKPDVQEIFTDRATDNSSALQRVTGRYLDSPKPSGSFWSGSTRERSLQQQQIVTTASSRGTTKSSSGILEVSVLFAKVHFATNMVTFCARGYIYTHQVDHLGVVRGEEHLQ